MYNAEYNKNSVELPIKQLTHIGLNVFVLHVPESKVMEKACLVAIATVLVLCLSIQALQAQGKRKI